MARDQAREPMTDEEIEELQTEMREQREEIRDYLAGEGVDVNSWDAPVVDDADPDREPADSD
jgi:hypothetical protein